MKRRVPSYYKDFTCIASTCEDTCCRGWDVVVDAKSLDRYKKVEGPFGDKLRSKMCVDTDGDTIFVLEGDRCPFLDTSNLCEIYRELGEASLCHTCQQYPRYMEVYGHVQEMGISLSCPEAARIILDHSRPLTYELSEDDQVGEEVSPEEAHIVRLFFQARAVMIQLLEKADTSLGIRTALVLQFVEVLQDHLDFGEMAAIKTTIEAYKSTTYVEELIEALRATEVDSALFYRDVETYVRTYQDLEHIQGSDPLGLDKVLDTYWHHEDEQVLFEKRIKAFDTYYEADRHKLKEVVVYFIYRYFMKSYYDYDMASKVKLAMMSLIMIQILAVESWARSGEFTQEDLVHLSHSYSKDVEHLEENIETLAYVFAREASYDMDRLMNTLLKVL